MLTALEQPDRAWRHYMSCCDKHLMEKAGLKGDSLSDVRAFVRAVSDRGYQIAESGGPCEVGSHEVGGWVVRKLGPRPLPNRTG